MVKVEHSALLYAQSIKDYILLHTNKGNLIVHMTMKYLAELLPSSQFVRVHRSYLVNQLYINSIGKNQMVINDTAIPIGESYKEAVRKVANS